MHGFQKISCMTRLFPIRRLLQTTTNGWKNHSIPSHVLQEKMVTIIVNGSSTSFPIVCQAPRNFHPFGLFSGHNPLAHTFSLLLFHLILVTTITRIFRFLLKPLKQPIIISQIIVSFFYYYILYIIINYFNSHL